MAMIRGSCSCFRLGSLQRTAVASLAQQGLVRCGIASTGGVSGRDGRTATLLAADHGG